MPEAPAGPEASPVSDRLEPIQGIDTIRNALGLRQREEKLIRAAGRRLSGHVEGWVDAFYTRLLTEPNAMRILDDDARVIRLKRSLIAWFHELFALKFDESFARARDAIGDTHVRIKMPPYLMVTAMSGIKRDVRASVRAIYEDAQEGLAVAQALEAALDMELALMLSAFRRHERALGRRHDRAIYAERAARRFSRRLYDRADAALCYAELARRDPEGRAGHMAKMADILRSLTDMDQRHRARAGIDKRTAARVRVVDVCARALENVARGIDTRIDLVVEPQDAEVVLVAGAVELAIEELVQNGVEHAAGVDIRVRARCRGDLLLIEVTDEGPGWGAGIAATADIYAHGTGLGLSFCEQVAEMHGGLVQIFQAEGGGAGVRLHLREPQSGGAA